MKIASIIARVLLGLIFVVFGLNGFFMFIKVPPLEGYAATIMGALIGSGWLAVVKALEVIGGGILLASIPLKKYAPVGLVILGPIIVNIFLFHLLADPTHNVIMALVQIVLLSFLVYYYRDAFRGIFQPHTDQ